MALYTTRPPAWESGVKPIARALTPATDSTILAIILAVIVLIGLNMRHIRRVFRSLGHDLVSVRRRDNAFDEHTVNETRVIVLQLFQLFVCEGLLLFTWLGHPGAPASSSALSATVLLLAGAAGIYYLFQLVANITVGYTFTDPLSATLWRRGLNASQTLLAWLLLPPALVAIFYPGLAQWVLPIAAALFASIRICYIFKGFRIFYINIPSLLYFILYLCGLEIVPLIALCCIAKTICVNY